MVNEISGAAATRSTSVVSGSRPELKQPPGGLSETAGLKLPDEGKSAPQALPQIEQSQEPKDLLEAVREINQFVQSVQRDLSFSMDEESGRTVIKVIDRDSGDTVRQIPTEEVLAIARHIREVSDNSMDQKVTPTGLLFSENI